MFSFFRAFYIENNRADSSKNSSLLSAFHPTNDLFYTFHISRKTWARLCNRDNLSVRLPAVKMNEVRLMHVSYYHDTILRTSFERYEIVDYILVTIRFNSTKRKCSTYTESVQYNRSCVVQQVIAKNLSTSAQNFFIIFAFELLRVK